MSNEELVAKIQAGENVSENMEQLYKQCSKHIWNWVNRFSVNSQYDHYDLFQESYFGFRKAVEKYNHNSSYAFVPFLKFYVNNTLFSYIGSFRGISGTTSARMNRYRRFIADYMCEHNEYPDDETIIASLSDFSEKRLDTVRELFKSTEEHYTKDTKNDEGFSLLDVLIDESENLEENVIEQLEQERLASVLWSEVDKLPEKESKVIHLHYQNDLTFQQIAAVMSYSSKSGAATAESRAIKKLQNNETVRAIATDFDYSCNSAYHDGLGHFRHTFSSRVEELALKMITKEEGLELLTPIEKVIYVMKRDKKPNAVIMKEIGCCKDTVQVHYRSANQKIEAYRQQQAAIAM